TKTIMIYMMGSDLESGNAAATSDMEEMMDHLPDLEKVHVLVYTGGSKLWHNGVPADANMVYELVEEGLYPVQEYASKSMGESETLAEFLNYGYENYPADTFNLICWDHGNGPVEGYGKDSLNDNDSLELTELKDALEASPFDAENKLALIGFDACLMSSAELACAVSEYGDYLIASQEVEPNYGWNYAFLETAGEVGTEGLVGSIIDQYVSFNESYFQENENVRSEVTLAAVDLSLAGELEDALNQMFADAGRDISGDYVSLASERVRTRAFGRASTGSEYDLVDLSALMTSMEENFPEETEKIRALLDDMVVCNGSNTEESCGLSLYYPFYNKTYYKKSWGDSYQELGVLSDYADYLKKYSNIWLSTDMQSYFEGTLEAETEGNSVYSLQLSDEQAERYASGCYYIFRRHSDSGNLYEMVSASDQVEYKNGKLSANFDGNIIYCETDFGELYVPLMRQWDTVDDETRYSVFTSFEKTFGETYGNLFNDSEDADTLEDTTASGAIQLALNQETKEVTVTDVVSTEESDGAGLASGKLPKIDLDDYAHVQFYRPMRYLTRDENGHILDFWEWSENTFISWIDLPIADGLKFSYRPLYNTGDEYYIMFRVTDVQGSVYCSEPLPMLMEDAPVKEEKGIAGTAVWESGPSCQVFSESGVTMELYLCESDEAVPAWIVRITNENAFGIDLRIKETTVNGTYSTSGQSYISLDANSSGEYELGSIRTLSQASGIGLPESIRFKIELINAATDGHLLFDESYAVELGDDVESSLVYEPYHEALADEQVLLEKGGIRVTLAGFGRNPASTDGQNVTRLLAENTGDREAEVSWTGFAVNGQYKTLEKAAELGAGQMSWLRGTEVHELSEKQGAAIETLTLYLSVDGEAYICPVKLSAHSASSPDASEMIGREIVYEDEDVCIYQGSIHTGEYGDKRGNVWIENKSDINLQLNLTYLEIGDEVLLDYEGADQSIYAYYGSGELPAGVWKMIELPLYYDEEAAEAKYAYEWRRAGETETLGQAEDLFLFAENGDEE
ncbi:MAG: clostripain-related cysteine peptidase, partial [Lachnospiraceae bacterium]|nr:clostripain-related cysteine peptidase [Lachnospiraceae bacterium]